MNQDLITRTLAEHATAVDHRGPDLDSLHVRVATARRRRHAGAGIAAVGVLVGVGMTAVMVGGGDGGVPDPAPSPTLPTPTDSALPFRPEAVEVTPPPDAREAAQRMQVVSTHRNEPGQTQLRVDIELTDDYTDDHLFCDGAPGTWLVATSPDGAQNSVPCDGRVSAPPAPITRPFVYATRNLFMPEFGGPVRVRLFVTTVDPANGGLGRLRAGIPETTTAEFGLVMHGQTSPTVGTIVGFDVKALGEAMGRDWWFVRGVEAPTGAESLTLELPASDTDRLVQTVVQRSTPVPEGGVHPSVQISLDGRDVDHRTDEPRVYFTDETSAYVPAGGTHTIELRITDGIPEDIDFGVAIFEAD